MTPKKGRKCDTAYTATADAFTKIEEKKLKLQADMCKSLSSLASSFERIAASKEKKNELLERQLNNKL